MKNTIKRFMPRPVRFLVRRISYLPLDIIDGLLSRRYQLAPLRRRHSWLAPVVPFQLVSTDVLLGGCLFIGIVLKVAVAG